MAEEKIVLTIDDGYCATKCEYFPIACSAECEHIDKPTFSYTRQEAIERIAKVFVNLYIEIDGTGVTYTDKEVAEEVLNALLEGK